jgi:hypothetical protein
MTFDAAQARTLSLLSKAPASTRKSLATVNTAAKAAASNPLARYGGGGASGPTGASASLSSRLVSALSLQTLLSSTGIQTMNALTSSSSSDPFSRVLMAQQTALAYQINPNLYKQYQSLVGDILA